MINLYRCAECPACSSIEAALQEMVVAYKVIVINPGQQENKLSPDITLPAIRDNGQLIHGPMALSAYLKELEKFVAGWRRFQSDSCYINDDGEAC